MRRIIAGMISSASLTAFSSAAGLSDLRPVAPARPLAAQGRPGAAAVPMRPGAPGAGSGAGAPPVSLLPRGSLLDLSV